MQVQAGVRPYISILGPIELNMCSALMSMRVGLKREQFNTNTQTSIDTCGLRGQELSWAHPDVGIFVVNLIIAANLATTFRKTINS